MAVGYGTFPRVLWYMENSLLSSPPRPPQSFPIPHLTPPQLAGTLVTGEFIALNVDFIFKGYKISFFFGNTFPLKHG